MFGIHARVAANLVAVIVFSVLMVVLSFLAYAAGLVFGDTYEVSVELPEAGGVLPGQEVTVLGHAVGQVSRVAVTQDGVDLTLRINGRERIPTDGIIQVLRRSPIGEQAVDIRPVAADWTAAEHGDRLEPAAEDIILPSQVPFLLEKTDQLFEAIDLDSLATVTGELANAFRGRGEDVRQLGRDVLDLTETLVAGIPDFERAITSSNQVLGVLSDHRQALAEGITNAADLTEVLIDTTDSFDQILDDAPRALGQLDALIRNERADLSCLTSDLLLLNQHMVAPNHFDTAHADQGVDYSHFEDSPELASSDPYDLKDRYPRVLDALDTLLDKHQYFFQIGFGYLALADDLNGVGQARVRFVDPVGRPEGVLYDHARLTPNSRPGAACESDAFGTGVNAIAAVSPSQIPMPITMERRDFAPQVTPSGPGRIDAPPVTTPRGPTPATGGGVLVVGLLTVGLAALLRRWS